MVGVSQRVSVHVVGAGGGAYNFYLRTGKDSNGGGEADIVFYMI